MPRQPSLVAVPPPSAEEMVSTIPAPALPSTALVASAVAYTGKMPRVYVGAQEWQREAYRHFGICGEARFAANFYGNAMSRAVLGIGRKKGADLEPVTEGPAVDLLDELFAGKDGQSQMLHALGMHLTIAGECYLVGRSSGADPDDPLVAFTGEAKDIWEIVSIIEMRKAGNVWSIVHQGYAPIELTDDDVVIRIWVPDPAERTRADSPFKANLPVLREIEYLTLRIFKQCTSQLLGAGLMFVDQDLDFPPPRDADGKPMTYANQAHGLMLTLAQTMEAAGKDPTSMVAHMPIITTVPGATLQKGKPAELMRFWTELDDKARDLRNDSIKRFALGLDMPPEEMLGMSSNGGTGGGNSNGVSHWGAWQVEEQTIKMGIEPLLDVVVNALTVGYLRPLMFDEAGTSLLDGELVTHNTAALRLRPDRSKEALELNARGLLKNSITLTENGFKVTDEMDEKEFRRHLMAKIATGSATPEQVAAAIAYFGGEIPATEGDTRQSRPDPSLEDHPTRPRTPGEGDPLPTAAALMPAYAALALRALERAGNRLRAANRDAQIPGCPAYAVHTKLAANGSSARMLADAWGGSVEAALEGTGVDVKDVTERLNAYCLNRLTTQKPHDRAALLEFMEA